MESRLDNDSDSGSDGRACREEDSFLDAMVRRMVDLAAGLEYAHLPEAAVHAAKARLIDSMGVAIAALDAPPVRAASRIAQPTTGRYRARLLGAGTATTPDMAAFVNGTMVRYLDFNDAYRTLDAAHPSDNLPGVLAMTEALGAGGRDFILALGISYEIQCRFTDDVPFNDAGWDQPVVGAMACALACGRLLGLDRAQLAEAVALASVPFLCTYQTRAGELSMWKGCAGPNGARNGIFAALLAAEGLTGPYHPFEGVFGIWNQTTGRPFEVNLPPPGPMSTCGLMQTNIKTYPVRDSCQLPIDTALDLRAKIDASDIASLHISTYRSAYEGAVKDPELWAPGTRETADHSMPFSVAAALVDGVVTPDTFEESRFLDADVLSLIGHTDIEVSDDYSRQTPGLRNCLIEATARDGSRVAAHRTLSQAQIERGIDDADLVAKFHRCAQAHMDETRRGRFLELAWRLEEQGNVGTLVDTLIQ